MCLYNIYTHKYIFVQIMYVYGHYIIYVYICRYMYSMFVYIYIHYIYIHFYKEITFVSTITKIIFH